MRRMLILLLLSTALTLSVSAQEELQYVHVRVVDVGPGLCCIVEMPGGDYMICDAGSNRSKGTDFAVEQIETAISQNEDIGLLVISHTDTDHVTAVKPLCDEYLVRTILHNEYERPGDVPKDRAWDVAAQAIADEVESGQCEDLNLSYCDLPRNAFTFGNGTVQVYPICGWAVAQQESDPNSTSIVVRLDYAGRSVLFAGDSMSSGEQYMIANAERYPDNPAYRIDSDVIIAPHHGAEDSNAQDFVDEVSPDYVIFSAGHQYRHPTKEAADRYIADLQARGIDPPTHMFRTDLGDHETNPPRNSGRPREWNFGRIRGCIDRPADDSVDIWICSDGEIFVDYATDGVCPCAQ